MEKGLFIPYPSPEDIRYAHWLKHFAIQLPAYSNRYELTRFEVLQMHCLALDFLDLLTQHTHWATVSIEKQGFASRLKETCMQQLTDSKAQIQAKVSKVVAHLQQHTAYSVADGNILQLLPQAPLAATACKLPATPVLADTMST